MGIIKERCDLCPYILQGIRRNCPQPCWIIGFSTITPSKHHAILYQAIVASLNPILHSPAFATVILLRRVYVYVCVCYVSHFPPTPCHATEPPFFPMHTNTHWEPLGHPQDCIVKLLLLLYAMKGGNSVGGERAAGIVSPGVCFVEGSENKTDLEVSGGEWRWCHWSTTVTYSTKRANHSPALSPVDGDVDFVMLCALVLTN